VLRLAPIFGKQAINAGTPALSVVALRTVFATLSLWLLFALRSGAASSYIYPVGLWDCFTAGVINGLGSLMYYTGWPGSTPRWPDCSTHSTQSS
jgi:hypothetical protein